jgi:hypothetical protein
LDNKVVIPAVLAPNTLRIPTSKNIGVIRQTEKNYRIRRTIHITIHVVFHYPTIGKLRVFPSISHGILKSLPTTLPLPINFASDAVITTLSLSPARKSLPYFICGDI